jgi:hypothetical protein
MEPAVAAVTFWHTHTPEHVTFASQVYVGGGGVIAIPSGVPPPQVSVFVLLY